jgi:hypothetical protein
MFIYFRVLGLIAIILCSACSKPAFYGFEPNGSRAFWEQHHTQPITFLPGIGERGSSVTGPLRITYSKPVTLESNNILLYSTANPSMYIRCRVVPYGDGRTYSFYPRIPLRFSQTYLWRITQVKDSSGKSVPDFHGYFQTEGDEKRNIAAHMWGR